MPDTFLDRPLVVTGVGRSGTSLVREILRAHPAVYGIPHETRYLREFLTTFSKLDVVVEDALAYLAALPSCPFKVFDTVWLRKQWVRAEASRLEFVQTLFESARRRYAGKTRVVLKDPDAVLALPELDSVLPNARVVICLRDPRAVLASMKTYIPSRARLTGVEVWNRSLEVTKRWQRDHGDRTFLLQYEELVSNTESVIRRLCDFSELDYTERMLDFKQPSGVYQPAGVILKSSLSSWRSLLRPEEVCFIEKRCREGMQMLGYTPEATMPNRSAYVRLVVEERARRIQRELRRLLARIRRRVRPPGGTGRGTPRSSTTEGASGS